MIASYEHKKCRLEGTIVESSRFASLATLGLMLTNHPAKDSPGEERQPAENEGAHDDAQSSCGLVFTLHLDDVAVLGGGGLRMRWPDLMKCQSLARATTGTEVLYHLLNQYQGRQTQR